MVKWNPENSIAEAEMVSAAKKGLVSKVRIIEIDQTGAVYVEMQVKENEQTEQTRQRYLATRREKDVPKVFINLERLINRLREKMPNIEELILKVTKKEPIRKGLKLVKRPTKPLKN